MNALKALVHEKGHATGDDDGIPSLCNCGAMAENVKAYKGGQKNDGVQMCASNCQFYKNEKGYVRALRDVLHSLS